MTRAPAAKRRPRAGRGDGGRLRNELIAATERLLAKTGDEEAVSIRTIADAVGVTPPAIYLHFPDKEALIFEVCAVRFADLDGAVAAAAAGVADPLEALRAVGRAYVQFGVEHPEQYRVLFLSRRARAVDPDELREAAAFHHAVAAVERCVAAGALPADTDPFEIAVELWAIVHGAASLLISTPDFPWPSDYVDRLLDTYLLGLSSRSSSVTSA